MIYEVIVPGNITSGFPNGDRRVDELIDFFYDANVALHLYQSVTTYDAGSGFPSLEDFERRRELREKIANELCVEQGISNRYSMSFDSRNSFDFEVEVRLKKVRWEKEGGPKIFKSKQPFMHARSFLFALDNFEKSLGRLVKDDGCPDPLAVAHKFMIDSFPDLREVRNSTHHLEDRLRGEGRNGKPLERKPINSHGFNLPGGGLLLISGLVNNQFTCTKFDGNIGSVPVTIDSMDTLFKILQDVINAFVWEGHKRHLPS